MSASDDLLGLIEKSIQERTFSLEALDAFRAAKSAAEKLTKEVADLKDSRNKLTADLAASQGREALSRSECSRWETREAEMQAREAKIFEHEKARAVAEAVAAANLMALKIVFAPNMIRESVFKNTNRGNSVYDSSTGRTNAENVTGTDSVTTTREEGTLPT